MHLGRNAVDFTQVRARDLHPDGALDAGREHIDAVADRGHPDVGEPRHLDRAVELRDQLVRRHPRAPLGARLELDRRLEHLERRRIGSGLRAAGLAEHARHFRHRLDHAVGLLQELGRLTRRDAGQRGRHVQEIALVERRHELAADVRRGIEAHDEDRERRDQRGLRKRQYLCQRRPIDRDQPAVERIAALGRNAAADQVAHQHGDQRHRESRGGGHGVGLGVRERREQTPLLSFECKHRHEREGDDEERGEERRADLRRGVADHAPLRRAGELLVRMRVMPGLDVLVRVLDHHHGRVDHRADGDGDAAERHDVGVHALVVHDNEGDQHAEWQRDDRHECGAQVKEKQQAHQRDDDEFLDQLLLQVRYRALDQAGTVVGRHDLDAGRQARLQLLELRLHRVDGLERVLS